MGSGVPRYLRNARLRREGKSLEGEGLGRDRESGQECRGSGMDRLSTRGETIGREGKKRERENQESGKPQMCST